MYIRTGLYFITAITALTACGKPAATPDATNAQAERIAATPSEAAAAPDRMLVKAMVTKMGDIADALETVVDENSARAATKKIAAAARDLETLAGKVDGKSASTKMSAVMQANSDEFGQIQGRIVRQLARLALTKPELMEIVGEEMEQLDF